MTTGSLEFTVTHASNPATDAERESILAEPGFGKYFTDHMVSIDYDVGQGWHDARVIPYGPIELDLSAIVLHYAQEIFEGMKAYRHDDGSVWAFRPEANAERMVRSSHRLALPVLPAEDFVASVEELVRVDQRFVPDGAGEKSLYLRPFMFASEAFLGVRPAKHVTYMVIASPAGAYFSKGPVPITLWLSEEYTRAGRGGMGAAIVYERN